MGTTEFPIKGFLGLNLRDAADKVSDKECVLLQNVYQPTKGAFSGRFGSVIDSDPTKFVMANRVSGIWRHNTPSGKNITIYHCEPDSTLLPDNTVDLILTEVASATGNLFGGGAIQDLRVCYSWIGRGMEQTYNSKSRAGFDPTNFYALGGGTASSNPGNQVITLTSATAHLDVKVPVFPTGVTGANIFVSRGANTSMIYVGTVTTSNGTLTVSEFIGPLAAVGDVVTPAAAPLAYNDASGKLKAGNYWIGSCIIANNGQPEGIFGVIEVDYKTSINLAGNKNAIKFTAPAAATVNGAKAVYVFIGTQDPLFHPMTCVGIVRCAASSTINILSIPAHNAQTSPVSIDFAPPVAKLVYFSVNPNTNNIGGFNRDVSGGYVSKVQARFGFLLAKDSDGMREIFPSRTLAYAMGRNASYVAYAGDTVAPYNFPATPTYEIHNWITNPRTGNDRYQSTEKASGWVQPYAWDYTASDPMFCYNLGITYFANGNDIPWMTDGYTLGQLVGDIGATATILPPIPRFLFVYQQSLVASGSGAGSQLYASNANLPNNWCVGGTGTLLRFVSIGDAQGSGVTAQGIFTPATDSTSNPGSFLIAFKKKGTWMIGSIPDPTSSLGSQVASPMIQVSGHTGCVAYRSIVQTPLGTMFLGTDGNVYLINRVAEPTRIGTKIHNLLSHLVSDEKAMKCVTAVYHNHHYKLSYPSPANISVGTYVNDMELWADLRTDEGPVVWVGPHIGRNIGAQIVLSGDGDDMSRLVADGVVKRTYTADDKSTYSDLKADGTAQAIAWKIKGKIHRFGADAHAKRILGAMLDMYIDTSFSNTLLFEGFADEFYGRVNRQLSVGGATWDVSKFDQSIFSEAMWLGYSFLFDTNLTGRTFQWSLSGSDAAPFVLASATLLGKIEKRRVIR